MNLSEILNCLYPYLGNAKRKQDFVIAIFRVIVGENVDNPLFDKSDDMLGRIFNGTRQISEDDAKFLLNGLITDKQRLFDYIEEDEGIHYEIANKFNSSILDVAELIADYLIADLEKLANKSKMRTSAEEIPASVPVFEKTLNQRGFDEVFTAVECALPNVNLFHLSDIRNNAFKYDDLQQFLRRNVGQYVLARAIIDKMIKAGDEYDIGAKALDLLRAAGKTIDVADEVGDIILYVFLEQVLKAPKIYSKIQLIENGIKITNQGGVHLLRLDSPANSYQLVIGKSNIVGNLKQAIDNAFEAMVYAKKSESNEMRLLNSTILTDQSFNNPDSITYLKSVIFPQKDKSITSTINNAFGVFLGYSLGIDKGSLNPEQFRDSIYAKMQSDIRTYITYLDSKIKDCDMTAYTFYFYLLPFNNADDDKVSIVKFLLGGDS